MENKPITEEKPKKGFAKWMKRFGVAGFLFFLIKGLIWIAIFVAAYFGITVSSC